MNFYKTDDGNMLSFEWGTQHNGNKSKAAGRPVVDKVLFVKITSPGMTRSEVVHPLFRYDENDNQTTIRNDIVQRFRPQIDAFLRQEESPGLAGTPLEEVPSIDIRQKAQLKLLNIHTVEQLANLSDSGLAEIGMGGRELQAKAKAFLDVAGGHSEAQAQAERIVELERKIEMMTRQLSETEKRGPGRPRKDAEAA